MSGMLRILDIRLRLLDGWDVFFNASRSRGRRLALIFYGALGVTQRCYLVLLAVTDGAERQQFASDGWDGASWSRVVHLREW
jgi:hypothetical protein